MERFPNEILLNIFQYLPIYSQHQCLQVCRCWNAVARTFTTDTTQTVELNSYEDIRRLAREVAANPAQGLAIRHMHFNNAQPDTGNPITRLEFINHINACPHLAKISLTETHPIYRFGYLCKDDVRLPQLEVIHLRSSKLFCKRDHDYINLMYRHRATINQMCVYFTELDINHFGLNSVTDYLRQFPCLKLLSLETFYPIVFDDLIQLCPQLQVLRLKMRRSINFKVMADERDNSMSALTPASQLETLKVNETHISQQLFQYLKRCCTFLSHLVITLSFDADFDSLISTFAAFGDAQALPISRISFENYSYKVNPLMSNLVRWFPHLNQVDIKAFGWPPVFSPQNLLLDFDQLNLLHVFINIDPFYRYGRLRLARIALELITDNATTWYEREETFTPRKQFIRSDNVQYTNVTARERKIRSENTVVISVKAANIQSIRILFIFRGDRFDQLIQLGQ